MTEQSPDYKKLYLEEQRRCEAAENAWKQEQCRREEEEHRRREEEQRRREEEQCRREEEQYIREAAESAQKDEQRRREEAEEKTRKTTFPEFLDAYYSHLHSGLTVQTDAILLT